MCSFFSEASHLSFTKFMHAKEGMHCINLDQNPCSVCEKYVLVFFSIISNGSFSEFSSALWKQWRSGFLKKYLRLSSKSTNPRDKCTSPLLLFCGSHTTVLFFPFSWICFQGLGRSSHFVRSAFLFKRRFNVRAEPVLLALILLSRIAMKQCPSNRRGMDKE